MLEQLLQSWRTVLTQPSVATFDRERPVAALDRAAAGVLIAGLIAGIGSAIGQLVLLTTFPMFLMDEASDPGFPMAAQIVGAVIGIFIAPIGALVGFFIWSGVLFLIAKALGGPGDFVVHSYLLSLVVAPLSALSGVLSIIPCLAIIAGLPIFIYQLVLMTLALQSAHGFSTGRAVAVWLIPLLVMIFLVMCIAFAVAALVITTMEFS